MTTALEAAKYLTELAAREPASPEPVPLPRVGLLLYFAQGWHLGLFGRPLFADPVVATGDGVAVPSVAAAWPPPGPAALSGRDKVFLQVIWQEYGGLATDDLAATVRSELPWIEASRGVGGGALSHDTMKAAFGSRPEAKAFPPAAVEEVYAAEAEHQFGNPVPLTLEQVMARRRAAV